MQSRFATILAFTFLPAISFSQTVAGWVTAPSIPTPIQDCVNNAPGGYAANRCLVTINRDLPISPPTLVLPGGTTVYLKLVASHWDEQVAFNNTVVHAAPQDLAADTLKSLVSPLSSLVAISNFAAMYNFSPQSPIAPPPAPAPQPDDAAIKSAQVAVDATLQSTLADIQDATTTLTCLETYKPAVNLNGNVSCDPTGTLNPGQLQMKPGTALQDAIDTANSAAGEQLPIVELKSIDNMLQDKIKACTTKATNDPCYSMYDQDQSLENQYNSEVTTLQTAQGALLQAVQVLTTWPGHDVDLAFMTKLDKNNSATISVTGTEIITKTATTIATVTINSATTRFVLSTGLMYTSTPFRSYAITNQVVGGIANGTSMVTKSTSVPSIDFPIVLGSYIIPKLSKADWENECRNHCAFLFSAGIGLNLGAKTADLAGGPSLQIGGLMITPIAVGARQNRLLNGVYVGQTNSGITTSANLPTSTHWTVGGGIAVTYTIPTP
jgi:hypothetical protein